MTGNISGRRESGRFHSSSCYSSHRSCLLQWSYLYCKEQSLIAQYLVQLAAVLILVEGSPPPPSILTPPAQGLGELTLLRAASLLRSEAISSSDFVNSLSAFCFFLPMVKPMRHREQ